MSIPLYFAVDCKEIEIFHPRSLFALTGFGLYPDGTARLPEQIPQGEGMLAVIDDAILPDSVPERQALDTLASYCTGGCFLDFMRPVSEVHAAWIVGLRQRLSPELPFWLPERYLHFISKSLCVISCPKPCNHWERFTAEAGKRFPNGWCLEVTPWSETIALSLPQKNGYLPHALCQFQYTDGLCRFYDTQQTITDKLHIAEAHGCRAAVGLFRELSPLFPSVIHGGQI